MIAPSESPYADAPFFFDLFFSASYPEQAMAVHYIALVPKMHPNLNEDGTLVRTRARSSRSPCRSPLTTGTAAVPVAARHVVGRSERVVAASRQRRLAGASIVDDLCSLIVCRPQLALSVHGLVLGDREPYFLEAGYERQRGTAEGARNARRYTEVLCRVVATCACSLGAQCRLLAARSGSACATRHHRSADRRLACAMRSDVCFFLSSRSACARDAGL